MVIRARWCNISWKCPGGSKNFKLITLLQKFVTHVCLSQDFHGNAPSDSSRSLVDRVASVCVQIHRSATKCGKKFWEEMRRHYYTTPSSYLEFIQVLVRKVDVHSISPSRFEAHSGHCVTTGRLWPGVLFKVFTKMLSENKGEFNDGLRRLDVGLTRLMEAKLMVGSMQQELVELGPKIEQKARDTEKLMIQLKKDTEAVNQVSGENMLLLACVLCKLLPCL